MNELHSKYKCSHKQPYHSFTHSLLCLRYIGLLDYVPSWSHSWFPRCSTPDEA
jgi:hypothetical protein